MTRSAVLTEHECQRDVLSDPYELYGYLHTIRNNKYGLCSAENLFLDSFEIFEG